jgi:leader peptidase (prepilin peptidase)/N-methyltransferase
MTSVAKAVAEGFSLLSSWQWALLLAPFVGSFLGVVVTRHAAPLSIVAGRSSCEACQVPLGAGDLVPLLSWPALGGKCRHCRAPIGLFYPAMELAALGVVLWAAAVHSGLEFWASCLLGWTLLALSALDLRYFLLPDFLTLPLIAAGILVNSALYVDLPVNYGVGAAAGYAFVRLLRFVYRRLRSREGMGLGDAKLLAAAGAWVSWSGLPSVVLVASLLALTVVLVQSLLRKRLDPQQHVPFGAFLSAGLWIVWLYGPLTG